MSAIYLDIDCSECTDDDTCYHSSDEDYDEGAAINSAVPAANATTAAVAYAPKPKQYWNQQQTETLLAQIQHHSDALRSNRVQTQIWSHIAQELNRCGDSGSGAAFTASHCSTKWRNLKRDLRLATSGCGTGSSASLIRNPQLMASVAQLESYLQIGGSGCSGGGPSAPIISETKSTKKNTIADSATSISNRRHSIADFEGLAIAYHHQQQQQQQQQAEPIDLSVFVQPPPPPPPLIPATLVAATDFTCRQRSGSVSSVGSSSGGGGGGGGAGGGICLRRRWSEPIGALPSQLLPPQQSSLPPAANRQQEEASARALLASLFPQEPQLSSGGSHQQQLPPPLQEARRTLQRLRQTELNSHQSRLSQLDHLISVIDSAIAGGGTAAAAAAAASSDTKLPPS